MCRTDLQNFVHDERTLVLDKICMSGIVYHRNFKNSKILSWNLKEPCSHSDYERPFPLSELLNSVCIDLMNSSSTYDCFESVIMDLSWYTFGALLGANNFCSWISSRRERTRASKSSEMVAWLWSVTDELQGWSANGFRVILYSSHGNGCSRCPASESSGWFKRYLLGLDF